MYGPPDIGYICRYKKVLEEAENDKFTYTINVTAYNRFTEPLTLSRIIVPLGFFNEKLQHLQLVIENKNFAYVFYKEEAHDVFGSGWFAFRSRNKFVMSYGF